jgi:tRNA pseudouridine13 synthase
LPVPQLDKLLGIDVYATKTSGVNGFIREKIDDFVVEEVLVDKSIARVNGVVPQRVLASSSEKQKFLICTMVKRNWDTFIAIKNVAKSLGIDQNRVQFAGIKDAKAVTSQFITLENISIEEVARVSIKDIEVTPIGYVREQMGLFYLLGNTFTLAIKHIITEEAKVKEQITQTIQELDSIGGIPNFYGHQRFGTTRPITHLVGKAIIQGNFKDAAMLFLANPSSHEHSESRAVRKELQLTCDFKRASKYFPKQLRFERLMLLHLAEYPNDFVGAFRQLPNKLQALFIQAHQSHLFNRFLSERVKADLPLNEAIDGDFVVAVERSGLPMTTVAKVAFQENLKEINNQIKAGKLRVALPIVGLKQRLSQGKMGQIETDVLREEKVDAENVWVNELARVGGKGGLRTVIAPIIEFKVQDVSKDSVLLKYVLLRGCYATIVLREIMKPNEPISAGF